jgi:hypothetical protein
MTTGVVPARVAVLTEAVFNEMLMFTIKITVAALFASFKTPTVRDGHLEGLTREMGVWLCPRPRWASGGPHKKDGCLALTTSPASLEAVVAKMVAPSFSEELFHREHGVASSSRKRG